MPLLSYQTPTPNQSRNSSVLIPDLPKSPENQPMLLDPERFDLASDPEAILGVGSKIRASRAPQRKVLLARSI